MKLAILDKKTENKATRAFVFAYLGMLVVIGILVPQQPNTLFYEALDVFLNKHMFGHTLPSPSVNFYFSAKVLICLSWLITPLFAVVAFIITLSHFSSQEIMLEIKSSLLKVHNNGKPLSLAKASMLSVLLAIAILASSYYAISVIYSVVPNEALTVTRAIHELFYGHFYRYLLLYITLTTGIISCLLTLLLMLYSLFHSLIGDNDDFI